MRSISRYWPFAAAGLGAAWFLLKHTRHFELRGKSVLVTGGSRGLGLLLAREFLRNGSRVLICARDAAELDEARRQLSRWGNVLTAACDLTRPDDVAAMVEDATRRLTYIDVLVNNAGIILVGPAELMNEEDYRDAMDTHFWGPLHVTRAVLPQMRVRREGRIVNITSIGAKLSVPHLLPYSCSKFALQGFSEGLRAEFARDGIVVTTVCPGLMRTGSPTQAIFKGRHREEYAWFSISDSLPLISMGADRAARAIVRACKRGDAEVVLTLPAKAAAAFHGLFPGLTQDILALVNRILPDAGGIGERGARGRDSHSGLSPSWLTSMGDGAAERNNETSQI
jgi:NAD(P)-dependent dehydrogenase (short-subunit alcohol dehydrogenase family)